MEISCACGAVGRLLPPDPDHEPREAALALVVWRAGNIGSRTVAVEDLSRRVNVCPACHPQRFTYSMSVPAAAQPSARRERP
jgi:hypothetical protein